MAKKVGLEKLHEHYQAVFNSKDGKQILSYNYKIADYGNLAWHDQYFSF